jgi:hypothetical protein
MCWPRELLEDWDSITAQPEPVHCRRGGFHVRGQHILVESLASTGWFTASEARWLQLWLGNRRRWRCNLWRLGWCMAIRKPPMRWLAMIHPDTPRLWTGEARYGASQPTIWPYVPLTAVRYARRPPRF